MPAFNVNYQGPGMGAGTGPNRAGLATSQQPPQYQYNVPPPPPPPSQYNAPPPPSAYPNPYAPPDREQENDYPAPPSHPYDEPQIIEGSNMNSPAPPPGLFSPKICRVSYNNLLLLQYFWHFFLLIANITRPLLTKSIKILFLYLHFYFYFYFDLRQDPSKLKGIPIISTITTANIRIHLKFK